MTPLESTTASPLPFDGGGAAGGRGGAGGESPGKEGRRREVASFAPISLEDTLGSAAAALRLVAPQAKQAKGAGLPRQSSRAENAMFEMQSAPNQLLEALRFFELPLPEKSKAAFCWGPQQSDRLVLLARYIDAVARDVRKLCLAEPRCVHVCVCVCVCLCVCVCMTSVYIYIHIYTHTYTYIYTYIHMYRCNTHTHYIYRYV